MFTTNSFGSGGFSSNNTGWGSSNSSSQATSSTVNNGTSSPSYQVYTEREQPGYTTVNMHQIVMMTAYRNWSPEELRMKDYEMGKKGQASQAAGFTSAPSTTGFGGASATQGFTGGFGQPAATSSSFGQPTTTTTGFGFGSGNTGFGTSPTAATTAGGFGQPASTGFGSNLTSGFGTQPTTSSFGSAFGQPVATTTTTATGFGSGFGQPAASGNSTGFGFGQSQPANATTTTTGFGQPTTTTGFGSGFGATVQPSTTGFGSGFGGTATSTGGFGQNTGTSVGFGQPAAATTSTFGGFGSTPASTGTTSGFGQPTTSSFGVFGNTQTKPFSTTTTTGNTGLFGSNQPATTTNNTGGGLFGSTQPTTTNLFGQPASTSGTSGGMFGSQQTQSTPSTGFSFGNTTSAGNAFGAKPAATTTSAFSSAPGLFGTNTTAPSNNTGGTFSFGGGTQAQPQNAAPSTSFNFGNTQNAAQGSQPQNTFSFGNTQPANTQFQPNTGTGSLLFQTSTTSQPTQVQQGPALTASIDQNAYGSSALLQPKQQTVISPAEKTSLPQEPKQKFFPQASRRRLDQVSFTPRRPVPSAIPKATDIKPVYTADKLVAKQSVKKIDLSALIANNKDVSRNVTGDSSFRNRSTMNDSFSEKKVTWSAVKKDDSSILPYDITQPQIKTPVKRLDFRSPSPKLPDVVLSLPPKYFITPPLQTLQHMSVEDLQSVANFSVSHSDFGIVQWLEPVDLSQFSLHGQSVLHRVPGEVVVLSSKACEVYPQSEQSWWKYHSVGQGLNRPAEITLYNCHPGNKPDHNLTSPRMKQFVAKLKSKKGTHFISYDVKTSIWKFRVDHFSRYGVDPSDEEYVEEQEEYVEEQEENKKQANGHLSFDEPIVVKNTLPARNLKQIEVNVLPSSAVRSVLFQKQDFQSKSPVQQVAKPVQQPARVKLDAVQQNAIEMIRKEAAWLPQVLTGLVKPEKIEIDRSVKEFTYFNGRVVFVDGSTCVLKNTQGIVSLQKISTGPELTSEYVQNVTRVLEKQLSCTKINNGEVQSTVMKFNEIASIVPSNTYEDCLWDLMSALFDEIQLPGYKPQYEDQCRKRLLSQWLRAAVAEEIDKELQKLNDAGEVRSMRAVLHLVLGRRIEEAVQLSIENKEFMLAIAIGQVGDQLIEGMPFGNHGGLNEQAQIDLNQYLLEAINLNEDVCMVYQVLTNDFEAVLRLLKPSWLRCFAMYFWYFADCDTPLSEVIEAYEDESLAQSAQGEMFYEVIKQFVGYQSKITSAVVQRGIIPSVRLLWHIAFSGLKAVSNADWLCINYAAELESMGLWHLSAFALLHLSSEQQRFDSLQELFNRNVSDNYNYSVILQSLGWPSGLIKSQDDPEDQIERFLVQQLFIAPQSIHKAKAIKASNDNIKRAMHLFLAEDYDQCHDLLFAHVLPSMFIAEQYNGIKLILGSFDGSDVANWSQGGQLYLSFFDCIENKKLQKVYLTIGQINKSTSYDVVTKHVYEEMVYQLTEVLYEQDALLLNEGHKLILEAPLPLDKRVQLVHDIAELVC